MLAGLLEQRVDLFSRGFFFSCTVRSTRETLITGTRTAMPVSLPASSGSTRPTASAAPVLLGIMFWVAERARYGSLW